MEGVILESWFSTLDAPGNCKNTDTWASPPKSDKTDLRYGLALGLFYKAPHIILMCIHC